MDPQDIIRTEQYVQGDWIAWLANTRDYWEAGRSEAEAIGKLWIRYAREIIARIQAGG